MSPVVKGPDARRPTHRILVVDDDRRVRELLEVALSAHGFAVITASDGDEAIKRALGERPDLVVLDVRLPKKSGLEVCDALRGDADDPSVPIILVSAAAEVDARLQAFSRGADDYLSKPFSPKELIARIRRMLSRSAESRAAVGRARELEHELGRALDEARRAHAESSRAQRLRELAFGLGAELMRTADADALARRLLMTVQTRLGVRVAALLARERTNGPLVPCALVGDGFERIAGMEVDAKGELGATLSGLGRPALCMELERIPGVREACAPFVASGFAVLAPIRGTDGLDALMLLDERPGGAILSLADAELLGGFCEIAAVALRNGLRFRGQSDLMLELAAENVRRGPDAAFRAEATSLVGHAARALLLPPRQRDLLGHGIALGSAGADHEGTRTLERLRSFDPTGRIDDLARMMQQALEPAESRGETVSEWERAILLLRAGIHFVAGRAEGLGSDEALGAACERCGTAMDEVTRHALVTAGREARLCEGHAA
jgi:DNA-binding response OmpR family regulator